MDTALAARWQKAYEKVETRCLGIAKDRYAYLVKSDSGNTYRVTGAGNVCTACDCPAGRNGDEVCWHRAAVYALIGAFDHLRPAADPAPDAMTEADRALLRLWSARYDADAAAMRRDSRAEREAINRATLTYALVTRAFADAGMPDAVPAIVAAGHHAREAVRAAR